MRHALGELPVTAPLEGADAPHDGRTAVKRRSLRNTAQRDQRHHAWPQNDADHDKEDHAPPSPRRVRSATGSPAVTSATKRAPFSVHFAASPSISPAISISPSASDTSPSGSRAAFPSSLAQARPPPLRSPAGSPLGSPSLPDLDMPRQRRPLTPLRHTPRVTAHPSRRTPTSASHTSVRRSLNLHGDGNGSETNDEDNDENRENDVSVAVAAQLAAAAQADATATDAFHAALGPPDSPVPIPSPSQSLANPFWDGGNPHDGDDDHSDMLTHGPPGMLPSHAASRHERWSLSRFASGTDEPVSQSDDDSDCFATPVGVLALNTPLPRRIARTASARRLSVTSPAATVSPPSASKKHRRHSLSTDADTPLSHSEAGSRTRQRWSVGAPSGVAARRSAPATPRVRDSPHAGEASSSSSSSDDSETEVHDTTYRLRRRRSTPRLSRTQQTPSAEPTATPGRSSGRASKKPKLSEQPHGALLTPRPSRSPSPTPSPAGRSRRRRRRRVGHAPDGPSSPPAPVPATRRSRRSLTRSSSRPWPRGAQASPSPGRSESDEPTTAVADGVAAVAPTKAASQDWAAIDAFCLRVESVAGDDETVDRAPVRV